MQLHDPFPQNSKPILLIHGLGSGGSSWQLQFGPLAEAGYRPLAPDLPGFGGSRFTGRVWTLGQVVDLLQGEILATSRIPITVVGISMGGVLAQLLALAAPDQVEKLVLVSTFACLRPRDWTTRQYLLSRFIRASLLGPEQQAELVARRLFPGEGRETLRQRVKADILRADSRVYRSAMLRLAAVDLRSKLNQISKPALVISGANDSTVPLSNQAELARGIQGARHEVIANAGHAVIVDQPQRFNHLLLQFLGDIASYAAATTQDRLPASGR